MERIFAIILLLVSTTALAERPQGCNENANPNSRFACTKGGPVIEESVAVPEPGTLAMMTLGIIGLIATSRRRR